MTAEDGPLNGESNVTMKIIIGIDLDQAYLPALHLVGRLGFKDSSVTLVQVAQSFQATLPDFPIDGATIDLMQQTLREAGEKALDDACSEAKKLGLKTFRLLCFGPSGTLLDEAAEQENADLVAVRTTHHGAWQSEFMGSVTRAVVLGGKVSTLVAKSEPKEGETIDVVFAVDGSDFNHKCVERWIALEPTKIGTIHVVTAWGLSRPIEHLLRHVLQHSPEFDAKLKAEAELAVERTSAALQAAGYKTVSHVEHGTPEAVLARSMPSTGADLLVVGAHGKNWVERLLMGSTSLHQVIDEPYNVLVLRP